MRNRHWAHGSQDVGSTYPVQKTGTKNLRTVNHRLATSLPACALEPSALCTLKAALHPQKTLGAAAEGQPTVWVEG